PDLMTERLQLVVTPGVLLIGGPGVKKLGPNSRGHRRAIDRLRRGCEARKEKDRDCRGSDFHRATKRIRSPRVGSCVELGRRWLTADCPDFQRISKPQSR